MAIVASIARVLPAALLLAGCGGDAGGIGGEAKIRESLRAATGVVQLPPGTIEITSELRLAEGARNLRIQGHPEGTILRAAPGFKGRGILVCESASDVSFRDFSVDGNRAVLGKTKELIPSENAFRLFYDNNGIWADQVQGLEVARVAFENIAGFAVLVSRSSRVRVERISVDQSGTLNRIGRNNTTGGVLIEEGTTDFEVLRSMFRNVRGNGVWTHSLYTSPRSRNGLIAENHFEMIGRDAIQVGHATEVRVEKNTGNRIGYPEEIVDVETEGTPVAIDTAGNVDKTVYRENHFEEINGKCFDLDGFHNGEVIGNTCINHKPAEEYKFGHFGLVMNNNNPDMHSENIRIAGNRFDGTKFGALFVIGRGHAIQDNTFRNINTAGCNESAAKFGCYYLKDQPDLLQSGIYLSRGVKRMEDTRDNAIRNNGISGHGMSGRCIVAGPGVALRQNRISENVCTDGEKP